MLKDQVLKVVNGVCLYDRDKNIGVGEEGIIEYAKKSRK